MSKQMTEIRWHGRGGQGAKTACLLLADAAFSSGKYVQGFPEYGPERMGTWPQWSWKIYHIKNDYRDSPAYIWEH